MLDYLFPSECSSVGCTYHRQPSQWGLDYSPPAYEPPAHGHALENLSVCQAILAADDSAGYYEIECYV
jgi:hypothetical protein